MIHKIELWHIGIKKQQFLVEKYIIDVCICSNLLWGWCSFCYRASQWTIPYIVSLRKNVFKGNKTVPMIFFARRGTQVDRPSRDQTRRFYANMAEISSTCHMSYRSDLEIYIFVSVQIMLNTFVISKTNKNHSEENRH